MKETWNRPGTFMLNTIQKENEMLGWRKLGAWFLVYAFVVAATFYAKNAIPQSNADLIMWVTGFFFGANALKPLFQRIPLVEVLEKAMNTGGGASPDE